MQFSTFALFITSALAATPVLKHPSLVGRDLATITNALNDVQSKTQALTTAINGFSGDILAIAGPSSEVQSAINSAADAIRPSPNLTLQEAIGLQGATESLQNTVKESIDAIIAKKDALVAAGVGSVVAQQLATQQTDSASLSELIVSKVPTDVQELARQLSSGIAGEIQRGVDAFADQAGAGGAASSGAAAPTAASSGAPAASSGAMMPTAASSGAGAVTPAPSATSAGAGGANPSSAPFTGAAAYPTAAVGYVLAAAAAVAVL